MMFPQTLSAPEENKPEPAPLPAESLFDHIKAARTERLKEAGPARVSPFDVVMGTIGLTIVVMMAAAYLSQEPEDAPKAVSRPTPPKPAYIIKTDAWACPNVTDLSDAQRLITPGNVGLVESVLVAAGCRIFPAGAQVAFAYQRDGFSRVHRGGGFWVPSRAIEEVAP